MHPLPSPLLRVLPFFPLLLLPLSARSTETPSAGANPVPPLSDAPVHDHRAGTPATRPALSPRLAALISAGLPKFAAPADSARRENSPGETDSPILSLPKYVVHGPRLPAFSERDISTYRGLTEIAEKKYITTLDRVLNTVRIPLLTPSLGSRALAMYDEDDRLKKMADLDRGARVAALADPIAAADLERLAGAAYQRTAEFGGEHGPN